MIVVHALLAALLLAGHARAVSPSGSHGTALPPHPPQIVVRILDERGTPLPGARVSVGVVEHADVDGEVALPTPDRAMRYTLEVSMPGYETLVQPLTSAETSRGASLVLRLEELPMIMPAEGR